MSECLYKTLILLSVDENIGEHPIETLQLSGVLGCDDPLGHFDFWPNGGNGQPGCEKLTKRFFSDIISEGLTGIKERGGCDHQRATQLPIAQPQSALYGCQIIGYQCDSYEDFNDGKCAECGSDGIKCKPLEFSPEFWAKSDNWRNSLQTFPNNYYFKTHDSFPFCLFHYQIVVNIVLNEKYLSIIFDVLCPGLSRRFFRWGLHQNQTQGSKGG